jgi:hypothetical protein
VHRKEQYQKERFVKTTEIAGKHLLPFLERDITKPLTPSIQHCKTIIIVKVSHMEHG